MSHLRLFSLGLALLFVVLVASANSASPAEAVPTQITVGLDMKVNAADSGTYNINSLPAFEKCLDVKTNVNNGIFYIDIFILNTTNLTAFNVDLEFTSGKMQIMESNPKQFFGTSSSIYNLSRNVSASPPNVQPAVSDGVFYAGAVDTGAGHTGHGVLARLKGQGFIIGGGSVIDFRLDIDPSLSDGVTLTDTAGSHPGSGADGLFDGPFTNQVSKIAVDRPDGDSDTVSNDCDNCPSNSNANQLDTDSDGLGDVCDSDDDADGIADGSDNCPQVYNPTQDPAACLDADGDLVLDGNDNCPTTPNANQANFDGDSQGDVCDLDDDNDGVPDSTDNCDYAANPGQENWNGNSTGDACEDADGDGWIDSADNCKGFPNPAQTNSDADGYGDICDNCPTKTNATQADFDTDLIGDACDDSDGDTWMDDVELYVGTKTNQRCATTTTRNDESPDPRPTDNDDNRIVNLSDVLAYSPAFGSTGPNPPYVKRLDLTMDNRITLSDVLKLSTEFGVTCVYP